MKGKRMSDQDPNRVLIRRGARELTADQLNEIRGAGGPLHTEACTVPTTNQAGLFVSCDIEH
jgi:hypothetical protein